MVAVDSSAAEERQIIFLLCFVSVDYLKTLHDQKSSS